MPALGRGHTEREAYCRTVIVEIVVATMSRDMPTYAWRIEEGSVGYQRHAEIDLCPKAVREAAHLRAPGVRKATASKLGKKIASVE